MARERKKNMKTTAPRARIGRNLNVWISDDLMQAFETLRAKTRRTVKAEVEVILETYLGEQGLWPPSDRR
jgi:hypothetical protein